MKLKPQYKTGSNFFSKRHSSVVKRNDNDSNYGMTMTLSSTDKYRNKFANMTLRDMKRGS